MYSYYELSIMHKNKRFYDEYSDVEQTLEISLNQIRNVPFLKQVEK